MTDFGMAMKEFESCSKERQIEKIMRYGDVPRHEMINWSQQNRSLVWSKIIADEYDQDGRRITGRPMTDVELNSWVFGPGAVN